MSGVGEEGREVGVVGSRLGFIFSLGLGAPLVVRSQVSVLWLEIPLLCVPWDSWVLRHRVGSHAGAGETWLPRSGHEEVSVQECSDMEGGPHRRWGIWLSLSACLGQEVFSAAHLSGFFFCLF